MLRWWTTVRLARPIARARIFLAYGVDLDKVLGSALCCSGPGRVCGFSGSRHVVLSGIADRDFATKAAAAYPEALCTILARAVINGIREKHSSNLWAIMGSSG